MAVENMDSKSFGDAERDSLDESLEDSDITEKADGLAGVSSFTIGSNSARLLYNYKLVICI
jgi:hypothetical protein